MSRKPDWSGGLYRIPMRIGLEFGSRRSRKMFSKAVGAVYPYIIVSLLLNIASNTATMSVSVRAN